VHLIAPWLGETCTSCAKCKRALKFRKMKCIHSISTVDTPAIVRRKPKGVADLVTDPWALNKSLEFLATKIKLLNTCKKQAYL
jgi:hypothetical protein